MEDHYKTVHSGTVVACIDHHLTTDSVVNTYPFYHSRISCSTSYMVYELMLDAGYELTKEEANMILVSMMVDTVSFRSKKTVPAEVVKAKELAEQFNLDYEEIEKKCLCLTPVVQMSIESIVNNGYKYYNYNGKNVKSSYVQLYDVNYYEIKKWTDFIINQVVINNLDMWVFIVFDCKCNVTLEFRITGHSTFMVSHEGILSRGTNIMPNIEKIFS